MKIGEECSIWSIQHDKGKTNNHFNWTFGIYLYNKLHIDGIIYAQTESLTSVCILKMPSFA